MARGPGGETPPALDRRRRRVPPSDTAAGWRGRAARCRLPAAGPVAGARAAAIHHLRRRDDALLLDTADRDALLAQLSVRRSVPRRDRRALSGMVAHAGHRG